MGTWKKERDNKLVPGEFAPDISIDTSLNRSEAVERFQRIFTDSPAVMAILRLPDMSCVDVNPAWESMWGYTRAEVIGKTAAELGFFQHDEGKPAASPEDHGSGEFTGYTKSGESRTVLYRSTLIQHEPAYLLCTMLDLTKIKEYEREMARLDRLNVIAEMAAGIGHEVRNPLTAVRGYLQMLQGKSDFAKYFGYFKLMIEELDRANGIITEFLSLAKDKAVERQSGNLNDTIISLLPLLQADAFKRGHQICVDAGVIPNTIFAEQEIRQLILNLVRNSLDAMKDSGKVILRTYQKIDSIVLEVRDEGVGIPEKVLQKLGTPFVTTKENGTGLGLPVCYRIAESHGAEINVDTGPQGTTFIITFNPPFGSCGRDR